MDNRYKYTLKLKISFKHFHSEEYNNITNKIERKKEFTFSKLLTYLEYKKYDTFIELGVFEGEFDTEAERESNIQLCNLFREYLFENGFEFVFDKS